MPQLPANPILVLGGGVHGVGVARELVHQGLPVCLVEAHDLAGGATAKSSRLIHGGLRYLEYGDVGLVRESLRERQQMLDTAPHFVRPLELFIPVRQSWSGLVHAAAGFVGLTRTAIGSWLGPRPERGFWPVRLGLTMYDWLAGRDQLPPSRATAVGTPDVPRVNPQRFQQLLAYYDAQMPFPERFVVALLADAEATARAQGTDLTVFTHASLQAIGDSLRISDQATGDELRVIRPSAIVNTTGAWGDATLGRLTGQPTSYFGGTKGSHFVSWNPQLVAAVGPHGVYAEAGDGRLVFILPLGDAVLVGTTDETFAGDPGTAVATEAELSYLRGLVEEVMGVTLTAEDITLHYSGVRPLPRADESSNAAVSREHFIRDDVWAGVPLWTLVGGKLTTWRPVAEQLADRVLERLALPRQASLADLPIPGAEDYAALQPDPVATLTRELSPLGVFAEEVAALWPLFGSRLRAVLRDAGDDRTPVAGTALSRAVVRWMIRHEHVQTLEDLVERRLLLVFGRELTRATLVDLAALLVECDRLSAEEADAAVEETVTRLRLHFGRRFA